MMAAVRFWCMVICEGHQAGDHALAWWRTAHITPVPGKQTIRDICGRISTFCCTALARLAELSKV
jgi:hypothetical protein